MIGECDAETSPTGPCSPEGANNIVVDHVTVSWAVAANLEMSTISLGHGAPYNYAILDSMSAESLHDTPAASCAGYAPGTCPKYGFPTSLGLFMSYGERPGVTIARNLLASNDHRMPWVSNGHHLSLYNNVFYNAGAMAFTDGIHDISGFMFYLTENAASADDCATAQNATPANGVHVGNLWIHGPNTPELVPTVKVWKLPPQSQLYFDDNVGRGFSDSTPWGGIFFASSACGDDESTYKTTMVPAWHSAFDFSILPSSNVEAHVLAHAGARPRERTSTDARIASEVATRTGSIKNCVGPWPGKGPWGGDCISGTTGQSSGNAGGWPADEAVVNVRSLVVPDTPNAVAQGQTFRTNLEMWLESMARAVE
jgi:hypothetical protein